MSKILRLDMGRHSIGWVIIDPNSNVVLSNGVKVCSFSHEKRKRALRGMAERRKNRIEAARLYFRSTKYSPIIVGLIVLSSLTFLLSFLNYQNWQFWLNLAVTTALTTLTLIQQERD